MLNKLLKYEFKCTARIVLPIYIAVVGFALLNRLSLMLIGNFDNPALAIVTFTLGFAYAISLIGAFVGVFIISLYRFYKNLLSQEGYLMFTLPVTSAQHIVTKLITTIVWLVCSVIVTLLSVLIITPSYDWIGTFFQWVSDVSAAASNAGINLWVFVILYLMLILLGSISFILEVFASISLGQLSNKHKVACSFGAYFIIYMIFQSISAVAVAVFMILPNNAALLTTSNDITSILNAQILPFLICMAIIQIGVGIGCFFLSRYLLKNKLNLE